jgi:ABC-type branched-subunit amino acid transport system substrate-binding protein
LRGLLRLRHYCRGRLAGLIVVTPLVLLTILSFYYPLQRSWWVNRELQSPIPDDIKIDWGEDDKPNKFKGTEEIKRNNNSIEQGSNPVNIVVTVPIGRESGKYDSNEVLLGVALAQRENNNSSQARKIRVGIVDDGTDSEEEVRQKAGEVARFLIDKNQKNIVGVIGHFNSDTTEEAGFFYNKQLVAISPTSTAVRCRLKIGWANLCWLTKGKEVDLTPYIFRVAPDDSVAAELLSKYANYKHERVAVIYELDSTYSQSLSHQFHTKFKAKDGEIIATCDYKSHSQCINKASQGKQKAALLLIPSAKNARSRDFINIIKKAKQNNLSLLGGDSFYNGFDYSSKISSKIDPATKGMIVSVPWGRSYSIFANDQEKEQNSSEFEKKVRSEVQVDLNWRILMAYEATKTLIQAIQKAKCNDPLICRGELYEILRSKDFIVEGALADHQIKFKDGDRDMDALGVERQLGVLVEVKDVQNGQPDFVRIK